MNDLSLHIKKPANVEQNETKVNRRKKIMKEWKIMK